MTALTIAERVARLRDLTPDQQFYLLVQLDQKAPRNVDAALEYMQATDVVDVEITDDPEPPGATFLVPLADARAARTTADTFTCCDTPMPWPAREHPETCPECATVWEHDGVDIGAGARIKTSPEAEAGPAPELPDAGDLAADTDTITTAIRQLDKDTLGTIAVFLSGWAPDGIRRALDSHAPGWRYGHAAGVAEPDAPAWPGACVLPAGHPGPHDVECGETSPVAGTWLCTLPHGHPGHHAVVVDGEVGHHWSRTTRPRPEPGIIACQQGHPDCPETDHFDAADSPPDLASEHDAALAAAGMA